MHRTRTEQTIQNQIPICYFSPHVKSRHRKSISPAVVLFCREVLYNQFFSDTNECINRLIINGRYCEKTGYVKSRHEIVKFCHTGVTFEVL